MFSKILQNNTQLNHRHQPSVQSKNTGKIHLNFKSILQDVCDPEKSFYVIISSMLYPGNNTICLSVCLFSVPIQMTL